MTLTVTDDDGDSDSVSNDVTVFDPTGGTTMHVSDLDGSSLSQGTTWLATVTITVVDNNGVPVVGAAVSGTWRRGEAGSCPTNINGMCDIVLSTTGRRQVFTVGDIAHGSLTYDSAANTDPDGDSDGTSITITAP